MSANFLAVGVVSVRPIADTHSYINVGIGTNEVVTTYEDKKISGMFTLPPNLQPLRFFSLSGTRHILTLTKSK